MRRCGVVRRSSCLYSYNFLSRSPSSPDARLDTLNGDLRRRRRRRRAGPDVARFSPRLTRENRFATSDYSSRFRVRARNGQRPEGERGGWLCVRIFFSRRAALSRPDRAAGMRRRACKKIIMISLLLYCRSRRRRTRAHSFSAPFHNNYTPQTL